MQKYQDKQGRDVYLIAEVDAEIAKIRDDLSGRNAILQTLIDRDRAEIAKKDAEIAKMDSDIIFLGTVVEGLQAQNSALKEENTKLKEYSVIDHKTIHTQRKRIKELDQECAYMDALTGAKMEAEAKWAKAEKHIKEKMDEIAALKGVITDMEADARRFPTMAEFSNLQDAYHDLEQEIAGLKAYKEATQNKESAKEARIKELEATHGWHCGCDHWNGPNLSVCAQCGRTPLEGRG